MQKMLPTRRSLQTGRGQPTASRLQKWRRPKTADKGFQQQDWGCRHLRKGSPRGSPCCHFGKIKFIKYIAIAIFDIWCGFVFAIGMGLFNSLHKHNVSLWYILTFDQELLEGNNKGLATVERRDQYMPSLSQFQVQRTWLLNTNGQCFNRFIASMTRECSQATTKGQLQRETNILVSAQGILVSSRMILVIRYYQLVFQQAHGWSLIVTNQVQPNTKDQYSNMSKKTNIPKMILAASYLPL